MPLNYISLVQILLVFSTISFEKQVVEAQIDLASFFGKCKRGSKYFDTCLRDGLNNLRPYFKSGLPTYGITPFDPFFAKEVVQKRSSPFYNYRLVLRNVTESGWTASHITKLRTDPKRNELRYTQFFPDKRLQGWYDIEGTFFGMNVTNQGTWNLALFEYIQTTVFSRRTAKKRDVVLEGIIQNPPLKVNIFLESSQNLQLHIDNLAGGRYIIERALDWIINTMWQPGFIILSPLINDLVSTAFTEIFNRNFRNFPLDTIFPLGPNDTETNTNRIIVQF